MIGLAPHRQGVERILALSRGDPKRLLARVGDLFRLSPLGVMEMISREKRGGSVGMVLSGILSDLLWLIRERRAC